MQVCVAAAVRATLGLSAGVHLHTVLFIVCYRDHPRSFHTVDVAVFCRALQVARPTNPRVRVDMHVTHRCVVPGFDVGERT